MAVCDVCGNDYDKAFQVMRAGKTMTFDSFECAIQAMAPRCAHCQCFAAAADILFRVARAFGFGAGVAQVGQSSAGYPSQLAIFLRIPALGRQRWYARPRTRSVIA